MKIDIVIALIILAAALWCYTIARGEPYRYGVYLPHIQSNKDCTIRDAWDGTRHLWPYVVNR